MKSKMQRRNKAEPLYEFIGERNGTIKRNTKEIGKDVSQ
jgi:hypothetical protein